MLMPRVSATATTRSRNNEYINNGIAISPAIPTAGDNVRIVYDGLLVKSGASDVFAHVGFGSNWDKVSDYRMQRTSMGFEASIPVQNATTLNLAFKDCANNWDNNSGRNYVFDVT